MKTLIHTKPATVRVRVHYLIYKTINKINGKIYYGKHETTDINDGYLGSGIRLLQAIHEFGRENFVRIIIKDCTSYQEMIELEKICIKSMMSNYSKKRYYNEVNGGGGKHKDPKTIKWNMKDIENGNVILPQDYESYLKLLNKNYEVVAVPAAA